MNNTEDHVETTIEGHEGLIKTPKQLIVTVVLAFIVPVIIIFLLIRLVISSAIPAAGSDAQTPEAIASRIKPVAGFALVDANAPKVFKTGEQVFESTCSACHTAGVAGAPKLGDTAAWAPLIKEGYESMLQIALHGKGAMPAKGGNPTLSDFEIERAVVYMANKGGASFDEPAEPAAEGEEAAADAAKASAEAPAQPAPTQPQPAAAASGDAAAAQQAEKAPAAQAEQAAPATETAAVDPAGEKLYKSVCFACHDAGVAGAPKLGDKAAWGPLIATGMDAMVEIALHGKGAMPPRGGSQASDEEIHAAVQYMVSKAQ
ncbi:c-type cytochrome [Pusillimonas noertemannii]|uniref:Cytochrome c5 n=1 Tax=Pusillimonas noertemannii TaxID=305977 RepID=A0A2U1CQB7_9BURK|nr:c-type cytochrome [Pusillimonas noertemannii]PVY68090.1 cytochrome c5 [Pusillimonas noertemannii]TFL12404.1 cytochrome c5 family protein [Pusillimonas noertemannii]